MKLREIIQYLESRAPLKLQESYDNSGLIMGDPDMEISGALLCLDSTEAVVQEAIDRGYNLVIAHHPIIFSGLKKLTGKNYVERTVIKAIRNNVAIYAIHTNLDNVADGVNHMISEKLGLTNTRILETKSGLLQKLVVFVPSSHLEMVRAALFEAGAGAIGNYDECSFETSGTGTFKAGTGTQPFVGNQGERHSEPENRLEVIVPKWKTHAVVSALKKSHPYEEAAFDILSLENENQNVGSGMIGELVKPLKPVDFLQMLKVKMGAPMIRYTQLCRENIQNVAVCGGSGSFLLETAVRAGADILVTSDFKYHQFFDADGRIIVADIGHFESEQGVMLMLNHWLAEKFPTFATRLTTVVTNPVNYL